MLRQSGHMVQVFVTTELLSDEPRASSSGEAAARHDDTRESLQFGKRREESRESDSQQPAALGLGRLWWLRGIKMELVF